MVLSIKDNWNSAQADHKLYVTELVNKALRVKYGKRTYIKSSFLRDFLKKNINVIAVGRPNELKQLIKKTEKSLKGLSIQNQHKFRRECERVLSYSKFNEKNTNNWNAYKLCRKSKYKVCPYCDQSYIFTVEGEKSAFRPALDHYYSKAQYPYLSVSLHNLIPSCYACNSNLKGTKDFYKDPHLNPLSDDEIISFKIDASNFDNFIEEINDINALERTGKLIADHSRNTRAAKSIGTFLLNTRYQEHLKDFAGFIKLKRTYTPDYIEKINGLTGESLTEAEMLRFNVQNYKNLLLGKIYKDLYLQFSK